MISAIMELIIWLNSSQEKEKNAQENNHKIGNKNSNSL